MSLHYDEKGKFYTEYVTKNSIRASIQTLTNRIEGKIYVRAGERVSDELNRSAQFLAVTDATIFDPQGKEICRCPFLTVNCDQIVWLLPEEQTAPESPE